MKKFFYIAAWIILGLMLSFVAHALIEIGYISYTISHGSSPVNHMAFGNSYCALPVWLQFLLPVLGVVGGYFSGKYFWRVIYIEKRFRNKNLE